MRIAVLGAAARRIASMSLAVIIVIAASVAVTMWRYQAAVNLWDSSNDAVNDGLTTETIVASFWHEREAMRQYLLSPNRDTASEVNTQREDFADLASVPGEADSPAEVRFRGQAVAGNQQLYVLFTRAHQNPRTTMAILVQSNAILDAAESPVLLPLAGLARAQAQRAATAVAGATTAESQALWTGIVAALLAILAGLAFAFYALRELGRASDRESERTAALKRLSKLFARLRSTSAVLSEVTGELRLAAKNAQW